MQIAATQRRGPCREQPYGRRLIDSRQDLLRTCGAVVREHAPPFHHRGVADASQAAAPSCTAGVRRGASSIVRKTTDTSPAGRRTRRQVVCVGFAQFYRRDSIDTRAAAGPDGPGISDAASASRSRIGCCCCGGGWRRLSSAFVTCTSVTCRCEILSVPPARADLSRRNVFDYESIKWPVPRVINVIPNRKLKLTNFPLNYLSD